MKQMSSNGSGAVCGTMFYSVPGNGDRPIMTLACSGGVRIEECSAAQKEEANAH